MKIFLQQEFAAPQDQKVRRGDEQNMYMQNIKNYVVLLGVTIFVCSPCTEYSVLRTRPLAEGRRLSPPRAEHILAFRLQG